MILLLLWVNSMWVIGMPSTTGNKMNKMQSLHTHTAYSSKNNVHENVIILCGEEKKTSFFCWESASLVVAVSGFPCISDFNRPFYTPVWRINCSYVLLRGLFHDMTRPCCWRDVHLREFPVLPEVSDVIGQAEARILTRSCWQVMRRRKSRLESQDRTLKSSNIPEIDVTSTVGRISSSKHYITLVIMSQLMALGSWQV